MSDEARTKYRVEKQLFWHKNGDSPTGFVIHYSFWLDLTAPFRNDPSIHGEPPPDQCPKFEGMNVYRTSDGPEDFIHFF